MMSIRNGKALSNKFFVELTPDLTCSYNLGGDTLYSVKWYKGRHEFYRYMPTESPIIKTFPVKNMKINVSDKTNMIDIQQCFQLASIII